VPPRSGRRCGRRCDRGRDASDGDFGLTRTCGDSSPPASSIQPSWGLAARPRRRTSILGHEPNAVALPKEIPDEGAAVDDRVARRRTAAGGAGAPTEGTGPGGACVCAPRLRRMGRGSRDRVRAARPRGDLDREARFSRHAGEADSRADPSDDGGHGRHPVRDDPSGRRRLRRHRRGQRREHRHSFRRRAHEDPLRLRRLLPDHAALRAPRATEGACLDAGGPDRRQPHPLGRGRRSLDRALGPRSQRAPRVAGPGAGHRRADAHPHRAALAGRRSGAGALARAGGPERVPDGGLDPAR
jgi:hypothetical protein